MTRLTEDRRSGQALPDAGGPVPLSAAERLAPLRARIAAGQYPIDPMLIANAIIAAGDAAEDSHIAAANLSNI